MGGDFSSCSLCRYVTLDKRECTRHDVALPMSRWHMICRAFVDVDFGDDEKSRARQAEAFPGPGVLYFDLPHTGISGEVARFADLPDA